MIAPVILTVFATAFGLSIYVLALALGQAIRHADVLELAPWEIHEIDGDADLVRIDAATVPAVDWWNTL